MASAKAPELPKFDWILTAGCDGLCYARVLLTRGPYSVGSYVYFFIAHRHYREPGGPIAGMASKAHWSRAEECVLTAGPRYSNSRWPTSCLLAPVYGTNAVLVTGEQLRFASEDAFWAATTIPQEVLAPPYARGARGFIDLRAGAATASRPTMQPRSGIVAGTDLVVDVNVLAPVPEDDFEAEVEMIGANTANLQVPPAVNEERTGATDVPMPPPATPEARGRQDSNTMSSEPEPQPPLPQDTPRMAPASVEPSVPSSSFQQAIRDPSRLDGYTLQSGTQPEDQLLRLPASLKTSPAIHLQCRGCVSQGGG